MASFTNHNLNHNAKNHTNQYDHPTLSQKLTSGQKAADTISRFGGSWTFIALFFIFLLAWIGLNTWMFMERGTIDPFPYYFLNLILSCLAAIQAPIILMTQNRQAERDRINAKYDYLVNRKAEREIQTLQKDLDKIKRMIERR